MIFGPKGFLLLLTLVAGGEAAKIGVPPPASLVKRKESLRPTGLMWTEKGVLRCLALSSAGPLLAGLGPSTALPGYGLGCGTGCRYPPGAGSSSSV